MFLKAVIAIERGMEYNTGPLSHVKPLTQKDAYSLLSVTIHLSMITLLWGFSVALRGTSQAGTMSTHVVTGLTWHRSTDVAIFFLFISHLQWNLFSGSIFLSWTWPCRKKEKQEKSQQKSGEDNQKPLPPKRSWCDNDSHEETVGH